MLISYPICCQSFTEIARIHQGHATYSNTNLQNLRVKSRFVTMDRQEDMNIY